MSSAQPFNGTDFSPMPPGTTWELIDAAVRTVTPPLSPVYHRWSADRIQPHHRISAGGAASRPSLHL
jgi:hypothetical protein